MRTIRQGKEIASVLESVQDENLNSKQERKIAFCTVAVHANVECTKEEHKVRETGHKNICLQVKGKETAPYFFYFLRSNELFMKLQRRLR